MAARMREDTEQPPSPETVRAGKTVVLRTRGRYQARIEPDPAPISHRPYQARPLIS